MCCTHIIQMCYTYTITNMLYMYYNKCVIHILRARKYVAAVGVFFSSDWCVHFEVMPNSTEMVL